MRLTLIFLLVILLPLFQKQWLNLYLFDINKFTIYKLLYYLSGLVIPIVVIINSVNIFTYYKFNYPKVNNNSVISGKFLFFITLIASILLSTLIYSYFSINFNLLIDLFVSDKYYSVQIDIKKQIFLIFIISILLLFRRTKFFLKKFVLINFFIISIIIWYSQINNALLNNIDFVNINQFNNINLLNIIFLLGIETVFYIWSYISYGSYLSDWRVPKPSIREISPILKIILFYILIMVYYSVLF